MQKKINEYDKYQSNLYINITIMAEILNNWETTPQSWESSDSKNQRWLNDIMERFAKTWKINPQDSFTLWEILKSKWFKDLIDFQEKNWLPQDWIIWKRTLFLIVKLFWNS